MPLGVSNKISIETADHPELLGRALHTSVLSLERRAENMGRAVDWRALQVSVRWFKDPQLPSEYECLIIDAEVPFVNEEKTSD